MRQRERGLTGRMMAGRQVEDVKDESWEEDDGDAVSEIAEQNRQDLLDLASFSGGNGEERGGHAKAKFIFFFPTSLQKAPPPEISSENCPVLWWF